MFIFELVKLNFFKFFYLLIRQFLPANLWKWQIQNRSRFVIELNDENNNAKNGSRRSHFIFARRQIDGLIAIARALIRAHHKLEVRQIEVLR